jgi:DNA-binding transcriptional MerR regulator
LILRGKRIGLTLRDCEKLLDLYETDTGEEAQLLFLLWKIGERKSDLNAKRRDIDASYQDLDRVEQNARSRLLEIEAQTLKDEKKSKPLPHENAVGGD